MPPTSTPPPGSEPISRPDWSPELLATALERAVVLARRDAGTRGAPPPPTSLRPVLGFTKKLPSKALRTVQRALETDPGFRDRVADGADEAALGRASWLFLTRPDGWEDELGRLASAAAEEQADTDAVRAELSAQRRAEQLADSVDRLRDELVVARLDREQADAALTRERAARLELSAARDELVARVAELEQERARAVKQLKATEATATSRLDDLRAEQARLDPLRQQVRDLEAALAERDALDDGVASRADVPSDPGGTASTSDTSSPWAGTDPSAVAGAVARAAEAAAVLGEALAAAATGLTPVRPAPPPDAATEPPTRHVDPPARPSRRVPVRLRAGVHDGSHEGLRQLLDIEGLVAIVDGYNVTMEGWPALDRHGQRSSLVSALGGVQARVPAAIHVVFDGDAEGRRPAVGAPLPVRVHFSPADTEADDVILSMVAGLPTDTPVLVVSSDRRVAEGARRLGANSVRSSVLLELLRR